MNEPDAISLRSVTTSPQLVITTIVVSLVLVASAIFGVVVLGGSGTDTAAPLPPAVPVADADVGELDVVIDELDVVVPLTTYEIFLARDPFEPIVPEDVAETPTATPTPGSTIGTQTPGVTTGTQTPGVTTGTQTPGGTDASNDPDVSACVGSEEVVCDGQVVTLVDIITAAGEKVAVIQIDTTVYEVATGEIFAGSYQLRAIDGSCVSLLYGDDAFRLCKGGNVMK